MHRRQFVQVAVAAPISCVLGSASRAQGWPTRAVTMIVPFPPGGQADLAARPVALALEQILGRSVIVDNRSGAGGMLGNAAAARAEPDGHTLLDGALLDDVPAGGRTPLRTQALLRT